jgi:hypothetical protein
MLNHYLAALVAQWQGRGLARSDQSDRKRRPTDPNRPDDWLVRCPCGQWGLPRDQEADAWLAICQHLFPQLDQDLDAWEHAHSWLYH